MEVWWQSLGSLTWMHQLGINGLPFNAAAAGCALQYQWPRCLHLASMENSLDVVSSNALAAVCHRIHHPHLAATLMGPLQMAAPENVEQAQKEAKYEFTIIVTLQSLGHTQFLVLHSCHS